MEGTVFLKLLNMSMTASWLVLAVILLRILLQKAPKAIRCVLWACVAVRLLCPFSFESALSLLPQPELVSQKKFFPQPPLAEYTPSTTGPVTDLAPFQPPISNMETAEAPFLNAAVIVSAIWLVGVLLLVLYGVFSYCRIHKMVREAVLIEGNIWICDHVSSPFIFGLFRPRIYLPSSMNQENMQYVLAHENAHLKRGDHFWKPLGFLLLAVYWFNPILWLAYLLFCRDIELACDERVIKDFDGKMKQAYSTALIACSVPRHMISACPLAFGEVGVKTRIKSVLSYKRPAFWLILIAIVVCIAFAIGFLTNPKASLSAVLKERGYQITSQKRYHFVITIPENIIKDTAYTLEGQRFRKNEAVVYQTDTTTVYLEKIMLEKEYSEKLVLCFNYDYHNLDQGTELLLPYRIVNRDDSIYLSEQNHDIADAYHRASFGIQNTGVTETEYTDRDSISVWSLGPEEQIGICTDIDVIKNMDNILQIHVFCNKLGYEKNGRQTLVGGVDGSSHITVESIDRLKEAYPQYFGLKADEGLTVCIWQTAEDSYSCGLLSGKKRELSTRELSSLKQTTLEEMKQIVESYHIPRGDISIRAVKMPASSYWYEIDEAYQATIEAMFWSGSDAEYDTLIDATSFDIDGDGKEEQCTIAFGRASNEFIFSAWEKNDITGMPKYQNTFSLGFPFKLSFERTEGGQMRVRMEEEQGAEDITYFDISIVSGQIALAQNGTPIPSKEDRDNSSSVSTGSVGENDIVQSDAESGINSAVSDVSSVSDTSSGMKKPDTIKVNHAVIVAIDGNRVIVEEGEDGYIYRDRKFLSDRQFAFVVEEVRNFKVGDRVVIVHTGVFKDSEIPLGILVDIRKDTDDR